MVDSQVVQGPCVEGDMSRCLFVFVLLLFFNTTKRCLWGKEERSDIMGSLLFRAYLVTSEILLR